MNRGPIGRLLIANRGEIAVRIARTADRLGIDTVGIYSEPDATALHVAIVDSAVALGGTTPADSYLRTDAIIQAALDTGCDAVHPGYGFLAENAGFGRSVIEAGLIWVGPPPDQIELLGDKVAAKQAATAAGVATAPFFDPTDLPGDMAYPVIVKSAAGGGGRGMRIVRHPGELEAALAEAGRESTAAFGHGEVFIESYMEQSRHIEVQILGDSHGNVIQLGERECSIQRRNQKLIEECPSAGITPGTRATLGDSAIALAAHVGYENAGTVEFLVGADGTINFLEVNTRLQVEHPVTEAVTGLDLVELQLLVASGEALPLGQQDVRFAGHAIEARLVAEDPAAGWLPASGRIGEFEITDQVRVDTGIVAGSEISPDYDSLVAKVIAVAATRPAAAQKLSKALRGARVSGVTTNLATLAAILVEPDFCAAATTTSYLADHPEVLDPPGPVGPARTALLLGAAFAAEWEDRRANSATGFAPSGWRNLPTRGQRQTWLLGEEQHHVEFVFDGEAAARVWLGAWPQPGEDGSLAADQRSMVRVRLLERGPQRQVVEIDGHRRAISIHRQGDQVHAHSAAGGLTWTRAPRFVVHEAAESGSGPVCPLPGTVIAVNIAEGVRVAEGDVLMIIEAMKMEHKITATGPAVVGTVRFGIGDRVDAGDLLVELHHEE